MKAALRMPIDEGADIVTAIMTLPSVCPHRFRRLTNCSGSEGGESSRVISHLTTVHRALLLYCFESVHHAHLL